MTEDNKNSDFEQNSVENDDFNHEPSGLQNELLEPAEYIDDHSEAFVDEPVEPIVVSRDFSNIRLYLQIAGICGPLSLLIGGILLGTVALIFAILAYRKLSPYTKRHDELGWRALYVRRFAVIALLICAGCLIANIVFVVTYMPQLTEMFTSGASGISSSSGSPSNGPSSTWG